uniref:Uncharacterized protein n=1 Tax=Tanacetum cinerariifolium TaxID=118510 RepID=A0A6L2MRC6_TANCI|nr:hypothetical protein [Tanacetum cinerariifolium]
MELVLMAKEFTLKDTTPTNNNQRSSSNPRNMQIAQPGMNMDQDRHMLMVEDNVGNQIRPNVGNNAGILNRYNAVQNVVNQNGNGNVAVVRAKDNGACEEIVRVNTNYTLEDNLQQALTSGTPTDNAHVYDSDGSVEVSEQKNTTKGTSVDTKFSKQSILGKPTSARPKLYSVSPLPKSKVIPKVGESNALSKPVTSNSTPSSQESTVVKNERLYVNGMKSRKKNQSANVSKS